MLSSEGAVVNTLGKVESHYVVHAESSFRVVGASIVIAGFTFMIAGLLKGISPGIHIIVQRRAYLAQPDSTDFWILMTCEGSQSEEWIKFPNSLPKMDDIRKTPPHLITFTVSSSDKMTSYTILSSNATSPCSGDTLLAHSTLLAALALANPYPAKFQYDHVYVGMSSFHLLSGDILLG
ncbi:hypothetical protein BDR06DRAFT_977607 [Suillus hirtellus]|nr:hypothetical protein BDR06DRAFT_977607 [Suillus hirtellus]